MDIGLLFAFASTVEVAPAASEPIFFKFPPSIRTRYVKRQETLERGVVLEEVGNSAVSGIMFTHVEICEEAVRLDTLVRPDFDLVRLLSDFTNGQVAFVCV